MSSDLGHVAVFAFPFTSHPLPLFNSVHKLADGAPDIMFSFFSTEKSYQSSLLSSTQKTALPPNIRTFTYLENIKPAEGNDLWTSMKHFVQQMPESIKHGIDAAVSETGRSITCLVRDAFFSCEVGKLAEELKVPWVASWVASSYSLCSRMHMNLIYDLYTKCEGIKNDKPAEEQTLEAIPAIPPPPLPPSKADSTGCLAWLDGQKPNSVAYVCFGTALPLPSEELVAIAEALEASGVPFIWSLADKFREQLPDGFIKRTSMRGMVVPWTPQIHVLVHCSVGAHVTHCGYNSVFESVLGEVPMICRPVWAHNHMNARMVEEVWGIGVRVEGGVITKGGLLLCLETIFQDEKGKIIRGAVTGLKEVVLKAAGPGGNASKDFKTLLQLVSKM